MPNPAVIDLRAYCPPIYNQGTTGSCTAQACVGAFATMQKLLGFTDVALSPMFVYAFARYDYNGRIDMDNGTTSWQCFRAMGHPGVYTGNVFRGICAESLWPQSSSPIVLPNAAAQADGQTRFISNIDVSDSAADIVQFSRAQLVALQGIKDNLALGFPGVLGIWMYSSFWPASLQQDGLIPMPSAAEVQQGPNGGHMVAIVGYDDTKGCLIIRNSWGTSFGLGGYAYLPYAWVTSDANNPYPYKYVIDYWVVRGASVGVMAKPRVDIAGNAAAMAAVQIRVNGVNYP